MLPGLTSVGVGTFAGAAGVPGGWAAANATFHTTNTIDVTKRFMPNLPVNRELRARQVCPDDPGACHPDRRG
jgi:hypothetical protein